MNTAATTSHREMSTVFVVRCMRYLQRMVGEEAVAEMLRRADLGARETVVTTAGEWCTLDEVMAVAAATAAVSRECDIGRRMGEDQFRQQQVDGTIDLIRATGSLRTAIEVALHYSGKASVFDTFELLSFDEHRAEISATAVPGQPIDPQFRVFCGMVTGYFGLLPTIFGSLGTAVELSCKHKGAERCHFRIVWDEATFTPGELGSDRRDRSLGRLVQLEAMASEIARPEDVSLVLERVLHASRDAVEASSALLVVRLPDEGEDRVHQVGMAGAEVAPATTTIEAAERPGDGAEVVLTAPVASVHRCYGHLSVSEPAAETMAFQAEMVQAFADHAATALDAAVDLAENRRNQATAEALLVLARSLASATDSDDVARRLAAAVPTVTGADRAAVLLWDAAEETLRVVATEPDDLPGRALVLRAGTEVDMTVMTAPTVHHRATARPLAATHMEVAGMEHALTVPIRARQTYLGTLVAAYAQRPSTSLDDDLMKRLDGIADQGAAALESIRLVEQVRHQALHDPLTGLPNRALLEDRARQALRQARRTGAIVGLLFVDLDHFKEINDTLGHAAGDEVIRAVGERLTASFRNSDTVARQGGDELVVLLPDLPGIADAERAAHKALARLSEPFEVAGQPLAVSASIGVSCSMGGHVPFELLLAEADAAMYEAKQQGRCNAVLASPRSHLHHPLT